MGFENFEYLQGVLARIFARVRLVTKKNWRNQTRSSLIVPEKEDFLFACAAGEKPQRIVYQYLSSGSRSPTKQAAKKSFFGDNLLKS